MKKILAATDGSAGSDRAVDTAALLAKAFGAELLVVNGGDRRSDAAAP